MTLTYRAPAKNRYSQDAVLSATPVRLLTMLYDRLMLDLARASAAQEQGQWPVAAENLLHAQAIIGELTSSLKTDIWDGAENLRGLYAYVLTALINANTGRDVGKTRECIELLEPLRQAWHEAAAQLPAQLPVQPPAQPGGAASGMLGIG